MGWTAQMSQSAEAGGNVTHSKMVLEPKFIIVMHVAVEPENQGRWPP
jgi:hypothetical protein